MEKQLFSNNKFRIFLFAIVIFIILGGSAFYLARYGEKKLPSGDGNGKPVPAEDYKPDLDKIEVYGFPIYPNAKFIKKERQTECGEKIIGFYQKCNSSIYTWQTKDDYDEVNLWYITRTLEDNWHCAGSAGVYNTPRDANMETDCKKESIVYGFSISSNENNTEIILQIPYDAFDTMGWKTFENKKYGFSLKYPPEKYIQTTTNEEDRFNVSLQYCPSQNLDDCMEITDGMDIDVYENPQNLSLDSWISVPEKSHIFEKGTEECYLLYSKYILKYNDTFSGENAAIYELVEEYLPDYLRKGLCKDYYQNLTGKLKYVILDKNKKIYWLSIYTATQDNYPELEKILYTFKLQ